MTWLDCMPLRCDSRIEMGFNTYLAAKPIMSLRCWCESIQRYNEPAYEIMVLITWATCEGEGEPAHPRSLVRAFAVRINEDHCIPPSMSLGSKP